MQAADRDYALTAEQRRQFETDGYIVLPRYFDPHTVAEFARAAEELLDRAYNPARDGDFYAAEAGATAERANAWLTAV